MKGYRKEWKLSDSLRERIIEYAKEDVARWGITIIPPDSLPGFQEIVLSDKRINEDVHLRELAGKIQDAINRNKFMIHFGV